MKRGTLIAIGLLWIKAYGFGGQPAGGGFTGRQPTGGGFVEGKSFYTKRLEDPEAVYFTPDRFPIKADGSMDVSEALQQAIREVKTMHNFGILFIPEGKYLISRTIYIPQAVRLIGYGVHRPLIVLGKNSPGFQAEDPDDKGHARYMFWFVNSLSSPGQPVYDAGASTFYSALSNIDLRIGEGNPAAVALRTHFAQHSFISHVDIQIGQGKAGLFDVGNEMEDVRFSGGEYGIYTTKPSPGWQFMMVDTWFQDQRKAAIRTQEAGLTIVRMHVKHVPTVIDIDPNYHEKLFMEDCQLDQVSGPAILISNEDNAFNQISLRNIDCRYVPVLAAYRRSGRQTPGAGPAYKVKNFIYGLQMSDPGADPVYTTIQEMNVLPDLPAPAAKDIPDLPAIDTWVNLRSLGAKGDGLADDTKIIQEAVDRYPVIYFPQGWYRVSETIRLRPNTVLVGLSPIATQLVLADNAEAFGGFGGPRALLEAPREGTNIVSGIGLSTGTGNYRAVACKWMAGEHSYLNDVKFIGGHGGMSRSAVAADVAAGKGAGAPGGKNAGPGQPARSARSGQSGEEGWDTQYWSLWITNGGGGTFTDIWTANTAASSGVYISNTRTRGRIYAMSVEHHVRNEIRFNRAANWKVYALQLEEESRESSECQPMELENCRNMVFANLYMFRVIRVTRPYPWSIRKWGGGDIEFLNVHNYSQIKYTTTAPLYDVHTNTEVRPWEFTRLYIPGNEGLDSGGKSDTGAAGNGSAMVAAGAGNGVTPERLGTGFEFADGLCSDSKGNAYFCESRMKRIYKWSAASRSLSLLADYPWEPLSLACDRNDHLLVVFKYVPWPGHLVDGRQEEFPNPPDAAGTSFSGWGNSGFGTLAYSIDPENPDETIRLLPRVPMGEGRTVYKAMYPAHRWRDFHDFNTISVSRAKECFVAPDGVTIIPVAYDLARSTGLVAAFPGTGMYATDEYDKRTVRLDVSPEGFVSGLRYFAERGEFSSAVDGSGNVYIADGEIYVYDGAGKQTGVIKVPERPTAVCFDGKDHRTLYITGRHSLYSITIN
jgi:hypothetical protein